MEKRDMEIVWLDGKVGENITEIFNERTSS